MNRRLIVSSIAKLDLADIFDAIADHNISAAERLLAKIETSCLMLVAQPFVGPAFSERYPGLRFRVVGKYVVFYRVFDDSVWIQRVLHSARDAMRLLSLKSFMKSTVEEIRQRFDADVERFSNLETGQSATIDAPLAMAMVAETAAVVTPHATDLIDVGCGAGNYSLKVLQSVPNLNVTLIDLSQNMLDRAAVRVGAATSGSVKTVQSDIREISFAPQSADIIVAAAVLHHLRTDDEWRTVFRRFYEALRPGGSIWIFDLVEHSVPEVQRLQWKTYGDYLSNFKDDAYRDHVFAYVEKEDTPKPLVFQLDLLREVGFRQVDVLHKHSCFAAFGAIK